MEERVLRAAGDGNVAAIGEGDHAKSVLKALARGDVAGDDSDGAEVELWGIEGQHEGHGVVGPGVGVEDDFFRGS